MQVAFEKNQEFYELLRKTTSDQRLTKYISASNGDLRKAVDMYFWNSQLCESLYLPLQTWEIALRNKLNTFLCWKYGARWPFEPRGVRQLKRNELLKVQEAVERQIEKRGHADASTGAVVADLSPGFWVALVSKRYAVPFNWSKSGNLGRIFPHAAIEQQQASEICNSLLDLRNRIAHHEPVFHLPLEERRKQIDTLLGAMCPASHALSNIACRFAATWALAPAIKKIDNASSQAATVSNG